MKFFLQNTFNGLVPCSDQDAEYKKKLKIGQVYQCEIKRPRNYEFHKKYFALVSCTWDCLNDEQKEFFKTAEVLRKTLEISAGHCERVYSITRKDFQDIPKSISFASLSELEFQNLYDNVKHVIFNYVLKGKISEQQFFEHLSNF